VPDEDSSFGTDGDEGLLVRSDGDLVDVTRVTNTVVVVDTLIVVPDLDSLVLTTRDEPLSGLSDSKSVNLTSLRAVKHSDGLTIEAVPVSDLSVAAGGQNLRFIRMVGDLLEHGGLKEAHDSSAVDNIPDDGGSIIRGADSLGVVGVDLDLRDTGSVLLQGSFHNLGLAANSPDSDLTFVTTRDDLLAITSAGKCGNSVIVSIVDSVEELTRLRQESSDLSVVPTGQDGFAIMREEGAEALEAGNLNSQKLLSGLGIPDTDVVQRAGGEQLRVAVRESDIIDLLVVASVSEFGVNAISVTPVDSGLIGTAEEMGSISGEAQRGNSTHDVGSLGQFHGLRVDLGNLSITSSDEEVAILEELDAVDTLLEQMVLGTNTLVKVVLKIDAHNVTGLCTNESIFIIRGDAAANVLSFNLIGEDLGVLDLLSNKVEVPVADSKVVNGDTLGSSVVVEANLVGNVHTNGVSNDGFAAFNLPNDESVVVLSTERCQELVSMAEGQRLNEDFVKLKSMHHLESVEVPNDNVSLEAHVSLLTSGNVFTSRGNFDN